jgi:hypothetical protein
MYMLCPISSMYSGHSQLLPSCCLHFANNTVPIPFIQFRPPSQSVSPFLTCYQTMLAALYSSTSKDKAQSQTNYIQAPQTNPPLCSLQTLKPSNFTFLVISPFTRLHTDHKPKHSHFFTPSRNHKLFIIIVLATINRPLH